MLATGSLPALEMFRQKSPATFPTHKDCKIQRSLSVLGLLRLKISYLCVCVFWDLNAECHFTSRFDPLLALPGLLAYPDLKAEEVQPSGKRRLSGSFLFTFAEEALAGTV